MDGAAPEHEQMKSEAALPLPHGEQSNGGARGSAPSSPRPARRALNSSLPPETSADSLSAMRSMNTYLRNECPNTDQTQFANSSRGKLLARDKVENALRVVLD